MFILKVYSFAIFIIKHRPTPHRQAHVCWSAAILIAWQNVQGTWVPRIKNLWQCTVIEFVFCVGSKVLACRIKCVPVNCMCFVYFFQWNMLWFCGTCYGSVEYAMVDLTWLAKALFVDNPFCDIVVIPHHRSWPDHEWHKLGGDHSTENTQVLHFSYLPSIEITCSRIWFWRARSSIRSIRS